MYGVLVLSAAKDAVADVAQRDVRIARMHIKPIDLYQAGTDRLPHLIRQVWRDDRGVLADQEVQSVEHKLDAVQVGDALVLEHPLEVAVVRVLLTQFLQRQCRADSLRRALDVRRSWLP